MEPHTAPGAGDNFDDLLFLVDAMLAYYTALEDAEQVFVWMEIKQLLGYSVHQ